jgi:hypothetical protein
VIDSKYFEASVRLYKFVIEDVSVILTSSRTYRIILGMRMFDAKQKFPVELFATNT